MFFSFRTFFRLINYWSDWLAASTAGVTFLTIIPPAADNL